MDANLVAPADPRQAAVENDAAARTRRDRRSWLIERGYRVLDVDASAVDADPAQVLDRLAQALAVESNKK